MSPLIVLAIGLVVATAAGFFALHAGGAVATIVQAQVVGTAHLVASAIAGAAARTTRPAPS